MTKIKEIKINPGCISCGACQAVCPEVFEVKGIVQVKQNVDFDKYVEKIKEAEQTCPVEAIEVIQEG